MKRQMLSRSASTGMSTMKKVFFCADLRIWAAIKFFTAAKGLQPMISGAQPLIVKAERTLMNSQEITWKDLSVGHANKHKTTVVACAHRLQRERSCVFRP